MRWPCGLVEQPSDYLKSKFEKMWLVYYWKFALMVVGWCWGDKAIMKLKDSIKLSDDWGRPLRHSFGRSGALGRKWQHDRRRPAGTGEMNDRRTVLIRHRIRRAVRIVHWRRVAAVSFALGFARRVRIALDLVQHRWNRTWVMKRVTWCGRRRLFFGSFRDTFWRSDSLQFLKRLN